MKKFTGLMAILVAGAALAAPAMARDRHDYNNNCNTPAYSYNTPAYGYNTPAYGYNTPAYSYNTPAYSYNTYRAARHDLRGVHNVRHDGRYRGGFER
jgi:hypothetical protein